MLLRFTHAWIYEVARSEEEQTFDINWFLITQSDNNQIKLTVSKS